MYHIDGVESVRYAGAIFLNTTVPDIKLTEKENHFVSQIFSQIFDEL